jgi:hypothetical protein
MASVIEMVLDGKLSDLKEHVETLVAEKLVTKIKNQKELIIKQINENKSK